MLPTWVNDLWDKFINIVEIAVPVIGFLVITGINAAIAVQATDPNSSFSPVDVGIMIALDFIAANALLEKTRTHKKTQDKLTQQAERVSGIDKKVENLSIVVNTLANKLTSIESDMGAIKESLQDTISSRVIYEKDMLRKIPLRDFIIDANELFISGGNLFGLMENEHQTLKSWLSNNSGAKLKLLLNDPEAVRIGRIDVAPLSRHSRGASEKPADPEPYARRIEDALHEIGRLYELFGEQIELKYTYEIPSVSVMLANKQKGRVSINLSDEDSEERQAFEVFADRHRAFYIFVRKYYEEGWGRGKSVSPETLKKYAKFIKN